MPRPSTTPERRQIAHVWPFRPTVRYSGQVAAAPTLVSDLISELRMLRLRGPDRVIARAAERGKRRASALLHA